MTLADDQERDRLAAHERELEAAKSPLAKAREWEQQRATASNIALYFVVASVVLVMAWGLLRCGPMTPAQNPESPEWPCGPRGVVCSGSYPHASCCWLGDVCGSGAPFATCPDGYCCAEGDDMLASRKPTYWQFRSE